MGKRVAPPAAVGVAGAEVGWPETDHGRRLIGGTRDGRETDTQTVSNRAADAQSREATPIIARFHDKQAAKQTTRWFTVVGP